MIAYPGRAGAHSAAAAAALYGDDAPLEPLPSFRAVAEAVASGEAEHGVLPLESSLNGPVAETHDLLFESPLSIVREVTLPIVHCLVAPAPIALEEIRVVHSHPVALDQCRSLLARLPNATAVAAPTTADAARDVADRAAGGEAAIASRHAADLFGLEVLEDNVGDHPEAYTRFVALATYTRLDRDGDSFRTAFSFVTDHRPGALHHAIEPFARHEIDLLKLVSHAIPQSAWRYRFDAALAGHPLDPVVNEALREAAARTRRFVVVGSYPAAG